MGSTADILGLIAKRTQTIDAKQMTIVPGFIDCHTHAGGTTLLYEVLVGNPFEVEFVILKRSMAYRTLLDAGVRAAAGSDFSPGPFAPLLGIQGMVTRTGWDGTTWGANQRISVDEAIEVNTVNGAYASREEALKGSITVGKLADFVVLADDPHSVSPDKIKDIQIVRTVVGAGTVYQA